MHAVLSSLVASSLLLHAVVGCCWHHQHATSCCDESQAALAADVGCHHHHGDDCCDDERGQPSPAPCEGGPHCHGVCNYLPVQKSQLEQVQFDVPLEFAATVSPSSDAHVVAAHGLDRLYELDTGPPLRLHLLHQILLI